MLHLRKIGCSMAFVAMGAFAVAMQGGLRTKYVLPRARLAATE